LPREILLAGERRSGTSLRVNLDEIVIRLKGQHGLTLRDGALYVFADNGVKDRVFYTPPLSVTKKLGISETGAGFARFSFALSDKPDQLWQELFRNRWKGRAVSFEENQMNITCQGSELAGTFAAAKNVIDSVNQEYPAAVEIAKGLAEKEDADRAKTTSEVQAKTNAIQNAFDNLEI
jgi:hypothetical protein